jgi:hypothetical protein
VPNLVQKAIRDPIIAYHIRELEFWGNRCCWDSWKTYDLDRHAEMGDDGPLVYNGKEHYVHVDVSGSGKAGRFFSEEDVVNIEDLFGRVQQSWMGTPSTWPNGLLYGGNEEYIKLALIASAPRLRNMKFPVYASGGE